LLYDGPELHSRLLQLMQDIWRDGEVVTDWKDAEVVPVLKKGDLQNCDNWWGISLLDVVSKLFVELSRKGCSTLQKTFCLNHNVVFKRGGVAVI